MIKNTGVIQSLYKKSLLYHKKSLTFKKHSFINIQLIEII